MAQKTVRTLTAYKCRVCELYHDENLLDSTGEREIVVDIYQLLKEYLKDIEECKVDDYTRRAIILKDSDVSDVKKGITRLKICSKSGRSGEDFTVITHSTNVEQNFNGEDNSALYDHQTFCYMKGRENVFVFYRYGKSGCKTAFEKTFNNFLLKKKLRAHFDIILSPSMFEEEKYLPEKITLITTYIPKVSDVADSIKQSKRKTEKEVIINLDSPRAKTVREWFKKLKDRRPTLGELKEVLIESNFSEEFDEAKVTVKFGNVSRKINLNDFTGLIAEYDITDKLEYDESGKNLIPGSLDSVVDEYALSFLEEEK